MNRFLVMAVVVFALAEARHGAGFSRQIGHSVRLKGALGVVKTSSILMHSILIAVKENLT